MGQAITSLALATTHAVVANVLTTALQHSGWSVSLFNDHDCSISSKLIQEAEVLGRTWKYEFSLLATWETAAEVTNVTITISEDKWLQSDFECEKLLDKLLLQLQECTITPESLRVSTGARMGTLADLYDAGWLDSDAGPENFIISKFGSLYIRAPRKFSVCHIGIEGATGKGKTARILAPNLADPATLLCSAIVTEATGSKGRADLFCKTAGWRKTNGHEIYYFNPSELRSHRLNVLDLCTTYDDVVNVVEIIMRNTTEPGKTGGDPFWQQAEKLLLTSLILHSVGERNDNNCHMAFVVDVLRKGLSNIAPLLERSQIERAAQEYEGFLQNSTDNQRSSIALGLLARLGIWNNPRIRELTSKSDLDFKAMQGELFSWYNAVQADRFELKPISALTFNSIFLMLRKYEFEKPLKIIADELPNQGHVTDLASRLTILRHSGISFTFAYQNFVQIENEYGKTAPLFESQPAIRIVFPPNDLRTAERSSAAIGMKEMRITSVTSSGQLIQNIERSRVEPPEKLTQMIEGQILVFTPVAPPVILQAMSWQDYKEETDETKYPPPYPAALEVDEILVPKKPGPAVENILDEFSDEANYCSDALYDEVLGDVAC